MLSISEEYADRVEPSTVIFKESVGTALGLIFVICKLTTQVFAPVKF